MRVTLRFLAEKGFRVPLTYNHYVQSLIYNSISPPLAKLLHDKGFVYGKRRFKLFTFSRILGSFRLAKGEGFISFSSPFKIVVSSAVEEFVRQLAEEFIKRERVRIGTQPVVLHSAEVTDVVIKRPSVKIRMLSPVTVYSTLLRGDGKKKTYYYSPREKEFGEMLADNMRKKFAAFRGSEPQGEISFTPLEVKRDDEKVVRFKDTVVKGWTGTYELAGDPDLIKLAYDAGLGAKNSQGFGCFELVGD